MEANSTETEVFKKIKEISTRAFQPRPLVNTAEIEYELGLSRDKLMPHLTQLKNLRLVNFNDPGGCGIRLTLLGSVVKR